MMKRKYRITSIIIALATSGIFVDRGHCRQYTEDGYPTSANVTAEEPSVDVSKVIMPVSVLKPEFIIKRRLTALASPGIGTREVFGTAFCLDAECRFLVTNYHVALLASPYRIKGQKVLNRYFATGPDDKESTPNLVGDHDVPFAYAVKRDLALFELKHPLRNFHGLKYSPDDLRFGQEVDIYSYAVEWRYLRRLTKIPARFKGLNRSGLLVFDYPPGQDSSLRAKPGESGGIVLDRSSQRIVGVLCGGSESLASAVPIATLLSFVSRVQPFVAAKTFPAFRNINPFPGDLYSKYEPMPDSNPKFEPRHSGVLEHRPLDPPDVARLRQEAQGLADNMRNFIAVESYRWGRGDDESQVYAEYEVRVLNGAQTFREYPDGKKDLDRVAEPRLGSWVTNSDEWSRLPLMVGSEYNLKIRRAADGDVDGKAVKVFQYSASAEDNLCPFMSITDYVLFRRHRGFRPGCYGEAWLDADWHIVRISVNEETSDKKRGLDGWTENRIVVTYGEVQVDDQHRKWAPWTIFAQGVAGKRVYWCRGIFSNYRLFGSTFRLLAASDVAGTNVKSNPN